MKVLLFFRIDQLILELVSSKLPQYKVRMLSSKILEFLVGDPNLDNPFNSL